MDQSSYTARVVGADPDKDVAVLQLEMPTDKMAELQPVSIGSSSNLQVGQKVWGVGVGYERECVLVCMCRAEGVRNVLLEG